MENRQRNFLAFNCVCWFATRLTSAPAWIKGNRAYPTVPVAEFLGEVPSFVHTVLFYLFLLCLAAVALYPKRALLLAAVAIELFACSLDVIRWQPFEFYFIFIFLLYAVNKANTKAFYTILLVVMASVYIYSGLHKFNGGFLYVVWENMILKHLLGLTSLTIQEYHLHYLGLLIAAAEFGGGLALLVLRKKRLPILLLFASHLFVLSMVFLNNYNYVIVPWNLAMIGGLLYLDLQLSDHKLYFAWSPGNVVIVLFTGILPFLSLFGYWDHFLSWCVYAGRTLSLDICIKESGPGALNKYITNSDKRNVCNGSGKIPVVAWSVNDLQLIPYPEEWYYAKFKKEFEKMYPGVNADFIIYSYPYKERKKI